MMEEHRQTELKTLPQPKKIQRSEEWYMLELDIIEIHYQRKMTQTMISRKLKCSESNVSNFVRYFKKFKSIPHQLKVRQECEVPELKDIKSYRGEPFDKKGFKAQKYRELVAYLYKKFPVLRQFNSDKIRQFIKTLANVRHSGVGHRPAKLPPAGYRDVQARMLATILSMVSEGICVICVDESSFLSEGFKKTALGTHSMKPVRQKRCSVIGIHLALAVSQLGKTAIQISKTAFRAKAFGHYIFQLLAKPVASGQVNASKIYILLGNSSSHRKDDFIQACSKKNVRLFYSLSVSPKPNPAEKCFLTCKEQFRSVVWANKSSVIELLSEGISKAS